MFVDTKMNIKSCSSFISGFISDGQKVSRPDPIYLFPSPKYKVSMTLRVSDLSDDKIGSLPRLVYRAGQSRSLQPGILRGLCHHRGEL